MKIENIIFLLLMFSLSACIDELDISTDSSVRNLVVEGFITTEKGPHEIKLSKSAKYGSIFEGYVRKEERAQVRIRDEEGNQVFLTELQPGSYFTPPSFQAEIGKKYNLLILTSDGVRYASTPEPVLPAPPIDTLFLKYKKVPTENPIIFDHGVEVYAQWQDPGDERNFYMWQNSGTYLIETNPELHTVVDPFGRRTPAPKDCCATCWVTEYGGDRSFRVLDDLNANGSQRSQLVAFIVDDGGRYDEKYLIRIKQMALSKDAYAFLKIVDEQSSISGDIFDPPPASIRGNILNLDDPENLPIGYFFACDLSVDSIFIDKNLLLQRSPDREYFDDCRLLNNSTAQRPAYW